MTHKDNLFFEMPIVAQTYFRTATPIVIADYPAPLPAGSLLYGLKTDKPTACTVDVQREEGGGRLAHWSDALRFCFVDQNSDGSFDTQFRVHTPKFQGLVRDLPLPDGTVPIAPSSYSNVASTDVSPTMKLVVSFLDANAGRIRLTLCIESNDKASQDCDILEMKISGYPYETSLAGGRVRFESFADGKLQGTILTPPGSRLTQFVMCSHPRALSGKC